MSDKIKKYEKALLSSVDLKPAENANPDEQIAEVANSTMQMAYRSYGIVNDIVKVSGRS